MSSSSHDYERLHGTQAEQAKRQSTTIPVVGGPFHLVRHVDGLGKVVMTNSVRTTRKEADDLVISECTRTGVFWSVEEIERETAPTCSEPSVVYATVRTREDDLGVEVFDIECRFSDGQKYGAVTIDSPFPRLAHQICDFLNAKASGNQVEADGRIPVRLSPDELSRLGQLLAERAP